MDTKKEPWSLVDGTKSGAVKSGKELINSGFKKKSLWNMQAVLLDPTIWLDQVHLLWENPASQSAECTNWDNVVGNRLVA